MTTRERVRAVVVRDLKPVRPLWPAGVRLLMLVPIAIVVALLGPLLGPREDIGQLGAV